MILESDSRSNTGAGGTSVHLRTFLPQLKLFSSEVHATPWANKKVWFSQSQYIINYLSFCKHTDISSGISGIVVFPISNNSAIEEGQVITVWVAQRHLGVNFKTDK